MVRAMGKEPVKVRVGKYWWSVVRRAYRDTAVDLGIETRKQAMIKVAGAVAVIVATYLVSGAIDGNAQIKSTAIAAAAFVALFGVVYIMEFFCAPAAIDADRAKEIDDLGTIIVGLKKVSTDGRIAGLESKLAALPPPPPAPRQITDAQLAAMKAAVVAISQSGNNGFWQSLIYFISDSNEEASRYAKRLARSMREAGLQVTEGIGGVAEEDEYGIVIRTEDAHPNQPDFLGPRVAFLADFFDRCGLQYTIKKWPAHQINPQVQVMIARQKPSA